MLILLAYLAFAAACLVLFGFVSGEASETVQNIILLPALPILLFAAGLFGVASLFLCSAGALVDLGEDLR